MALTWSSASVFTSIKPEVTAVCWSGTFTCVNRMAWRKDISKDLREAIIVAINLVRMIIHKWNTFKTVANLLRNGRLSKFIQSCIWTNLKISGTMSFGQTRPKRRCLTIIIYYTQHISTNTSFQLSITLVKGLVIFGMFFSHRTWAPCNLWFDHYLLWIPKYSSVKCEEAILSDS